MSASTSTGVALGDVPLFAGADAAYLKGFASRAQFSTYEPGVLILDFDDTSNDVFFIMTGKVRALIRTPGGREVILGDIGAGGIFGDMAAIDDSRRSASITALNRSGLWRMSGAAFVECITHSPMIARRFMRLLAERVRLGNTRLVEHSALTGKHRLYSELLRESRPRPGHATERTISPPPVQQILASRIGIRREAVSREMADLIRRGVLARTPGALIILRPDDLEASIASELDD